MQAQRNTPYNVFPLILFTPSKILTRWNVKYLLY